MKHLLGKLTHTALGTLVSSATFFSFKDKDDSSSSRQSVTGNIQPNEEPTFTLQDVANHNCDATGYWVSYGDGVYDVTNFINVHQAGEYYIKLAAGGRVEPFWNLYRNHLTSEIRAPQVIEPMRIGKLAEKDQIEMPDTFEHFENQPTRVNEHNMLVFGQLPYYCEPKAPLFGESLITPNELFFVRNHFPVPTDTAKEHELHIHLSETSCGMNYDEMNENWDDITGDCTFKLDDLINSENFKPIEITTTIQCAGNRYHEYNEAKFPVIGYISTAKWKGILIRDIIEYCAKFQQSDDIDILDSIVNLNYNYNYVTFYGNDCDMANIHYAMSVPIEYILNKDNECIIALEMNDEILPRDHGYPMRVIIPGVAGCRSVKWVKHIQFTQNAVESPWQKKKYKICDTPVFDMPVTSIITNPTRHSVIDIDRSYSARSVTSSGDHDIEYLEVNGVAYAGGGRGIIKVECSIDDGVNWFECQLNGIEQTKGKQWCWTMWDCKIPIVAIDDMIIGRKDNSKELTVMCRAMDTSFNSQPSTWQEIDNGAFYCENAWHRVPVVVNS